MYTPEQTIELVEAAYERGFSAGARNAYDTVAFLDSYGVGETSDTGDGVEPESDSSAYDALYLEITGEKVDDLLERVVGLERWAYSTPVAPDEQKCGCTCDRLH